MEVAVVVAVQTMEPAMFDTLEETATVEAVVAAEAVVATEVAEETMEVAVATEVVAMVVAATEAAAAIGAAAEEEEAMEIGAVAPGNRKHPFSPLGILRSLSIVVLSR